MRTPNLNDAIQRSTFLLLLWDSCRICCMTGNAKLTEFGFFPRTIEAALDRGRKSRN